MLALRDDALGLPYASLLSACLNAGLRKNAHLIRCVDVEETAAVVAQLMRKGGCAPGVPTGAAPPAPLTKRKKDADPKLVFARMLMIIPSVSENVAKKLVEHFGTLPALQKALVEKRFPKVKLDERQTLGKGRVKKLAQYLL